MFRLPSVAFIVNSGKSSSSFARQLTWQAGLAIRALSKINKPSNPLKTNVWTIHCQYGIVYQDHWQTYHIFQSHDVVSHFKYKLQTTNKTRKTSKTKHYIKLHYIKLHSITLNYIELQTTNQTRKTSSIKAT